MNILEDPAFIEFRGVFDGQIKRQNATAWKTSVISIEMKERLQLIG